MIDFLRRNNPESLPKVRNLNLDADDSPEIQRRKRKEDAATSGKEHERGDKNPGVHSEEKDGANA